MANKTEVRIDEILKYGGIRSKHFRSLTIDKHPRSVWNALRHGMLALYGVDITQVRQQRLRKGGRR